MSLILDDVPNEALDQEAQALGDIEQELELLGITKKSEPAPPVQVEAEEMTWEQLLDHREKMKELKKQAKADKVSQAQKRAKEQLEAIKSSLVAEPGAKTGEPGATAPKAEESEEDESSSSEEAEFIKKAVKKTLKKKKTQKAGKNHPKQQGQLLRNAL